MPDVRKLLSRLDGEPADAIESEELECKPWNPDPLDRRSQFREVREAVVCLANARGGVILLGVADKKRSRADAIQGVGDLQIAQLRKSIYDGTDPRILVEVEELKEPEGRLLVIRVPRGIPPHTTTEGVGKIRVGKECKPLTGSDLSRLLTAGGERDLTAEILPGSSEKDLELDHVRMFQRTIEAEAGNQELARLQPPELLRNLQLVRENELTLAAVLLMGTPGALTRWAPQHEVIFLRFKNRTRFDVRHDLKGPLLAVLDVLRRVFESHLKITIVEGAGFTEQAIPDLSAWTAREAVLNALVHRDYFLRQAVQIELHKDRVEVISPGGFVGGITPQNILRHGPVRRNPLLASALQSAGLVNRAGLGVDRIYEELLRLGKCMPKYEGDEGHVRLTLPRSTHTAFARFVGDETTAGHNLDLDDLIVLRSLVDRGFLDRWSAAERLQLSEDEAADKLASLREAGYLVAHGRGRGTSYRLRRELSDRLRGAYATDTDGTLDHEAVRLRVEAVLSERGRLTNTEARRLSGFSRVEVLRLMRELVEEGKAELRGRGRGAHYVAGKSLKRPR